MEPRLSKAIAHPTGYRLPTGNLLILLVGAQDSNQAPGPDAA
jgi:hypothetical protein